MTRTDLNAMYRHSQLKYSAALIILAIFLSICFLLSLSQGPMKLPPIEIIRIVAGKLFTDSGLLTGIKESRIAVIWEIRLPRILVGAFAGSGLAVAGLIFQSLLHNPLADPYTLGISTGAAFGASLVLFFNITSGLLLPLVPFAFLSAFLTLITVLAISHRGGGLESSNLIIAGIIVSSILASGISLIKMLAGENVSAIVFWLMGSLSSRSWSDFVVVAPIVTLCIILASLRAGELNIMSQGDRTAKSLGVNVRSNRLYFLIIASCITAVCVASCGIIGFIGLIVPHMLRFSLTHDNRRLVPLSAFAGALLLCLADWGARLLARGEIPVGVLTTLLGGPFFIWLFMRRKGRGTYL